MATVEIVRPIRGNMGSQVLVKRGDHYFIVSTIPGETLVFPANAQGKPTSLREIMRASGGQGWTRHDAIEALGRMTDEEIREVSK